MDDIPDWPRMNTLEGCYGIVRNLRSIVECENGTDASRLLEELTKNLNSHRKCLNKVEKFAYEMMSTRFNGYRGGQTSQENIPEKDEPAADTVLTEVDSGRPCAVLYRKAVYRATIQMSGTSDLLVCLVDYGSRHFIARPHVFVLPEVLMLYCQPLAYFCCLADTGSRIVNNAAIMDFTRAAADHPEVDIMACGSLRNGSREIVYITSPDGPKYKVRQSTRKRSRKSGNGRSRGGGGSCFNSTEDLRAVTFYVAGDTDWEEDEFSTLCDEHQPAKTTVVAPAKPLKS